MESKSLSVSVSNPNSDFDPKSFRLTQSIQSFRTWSSGPGLSRFTGVRDIRLFRKNIILAQRRRGAEKVKTRISSHYRAKSYFKALMF